MKPSSCIFNLIAELATKRGNIPIKDKIYHVKLEEYEYWVNGFKEHKNIDVLTQKIPPFSCYVKFNGWPFAIFNPYSGQIGAGLIANEDNFIKALEEAIKREKT